MSNLITITCRNVKNATNIKEEIEAFLRKKGYIVGKLGDNNIVVDYSENVESENMKISICQFLG